MQGLTKQNTMAITCKTCSKLLQVRTFFSNLNSGAPLLSSHPTFTLFNNEQKVLKCAVPVTVPESPGQAYYDAIDACLTTPAERVTWTLCNPDVASSLAPNANGQLPYLVVTPRLTMGTGAATILTTGIVREVRASQMWRA